MAHHFNDMPDTQTWAILVGAVKTAAKERGYSLTRVPGRGRSNVWQVERAGERLRASFRTTKNRWIAFPPLKGGTRWKTLTDVDLVFVAAVDDRETPRNIEVYEFTAAEVRERFDAAYQARIKAGQVVQDNFGMWVNLDLDDRGLPVSVGSGLAHKYQPIAVYPIASLIDVEVPSEEVEGDVEDEPASTAPLLRPRQPTTIAEVLADARKRISELAGVGHDAVKLDLKIEY